MFFFATETFTNIPEYKKLEILNRLFYYKNQFTIKLVRQLRRKQNHNQEVKHRLKGRLSEGLL